MPYFTEQRWKPNYEQTQQAIRPTQIIVHSMGDGWNFEGGVARLSGGDGPPCAHYAIRVDGYRVQLIPDDWAVAAAHTADRRPDGTGAIAIQTDSDVDLAEPWSPDQVASIVELVGLLCASYGIPTELTPGPDEPGLGHHAMWGTPGAWADSDAPCPGQARIAQFMSIVVPAVASGVQPAHPNTGQAKMLKLIVPTSWSRPARPVFLSLNNSTLRWVRSKWELDVIQSDMSAAGFDNRIFEVPSLEPYGVTFLGPVPAGTPSAWVREPQV